MTGPDKSAEPLQDRDWGLTCAELLELTTEYLEGALSPADTSRFDTHLAKCEGCVVVLDQLRYQIKVTGEIQEDRIEPEALERLLDAFADWRRSIQS